MIRPWIEATLVLACAFAGWELGRRFGRRSDRLWVVGYFAPLIPILLVALGSFVRPLEFTIPFRWFMVGRIEFVVMAFAGPMVLATPVARLPARRLQILIGIFLAGIVFNLVAWPFLWPAFNHRLFATMQTRVDKDGVCLQNTAYTCGPAAAVTVLRRLGFTAEEGALAQVFGTTSGMGTPPDILAERLQRRHESEGLKAEYRPYHSVSDLGSNVLAVVKFKLFIDHYVAVLEVTPESVVVGDPLSGKEILSREAFEKRWRKVGVALSRESERKNH